MSSSSDKSYKSISEVCEILGLVDKKSGKKNTHVLRFWEKKFPNTKPSLIYKGRRYYSKKNIDELLEVKRLLKLEGYSIRGAQNFIKNNKIDYKSNPNISATKANKIKTIIEDIKKLV